MTVQQSPVSERMLKHGKARTFRIVRLPAPRQEPSALKDMAGRMRGLRSKNATEIDSATRSVSSDLSGRNRIGGTLWLPLDRVPHPPASPRLLRPETQRLNKRVTLRSPDVIGAVEAGMDVSLKLVQRWTRVQMISELVWSLQAVG